MTSSGRTLVCSVLFLDIAGYSKRPVSEQLLLKEAFNRLLANALGEAATHSRVILDTGDGAAIVFLGAPEDALFVATALRDTAAGNLALRMGINLGPVRLVEDLNGQTNVIGDGINDAQRVMGFADPGHLMVSRPFHDIVSRLSSDYENLFTFEGSHRDKHRRSHDLYSVAASAAAERRAPDRPAVPPDHREDAAFSEAQVFDAGANLIVSGFRRSSVEDALNRLAAEGVGVISPIARVGNKWVASCAHAGAPINTCKVEELGLTRIVTGPSREAVSAKIEDLVRQGAVQVGEIEFTDGAWSAVCDTGGFWR